MSTELPVPEAALDGDALLRALADLRAQPPPGDPSSAGCAISVAAVVALVFMPVLTRAVDWPGSVFFWVGVGLFAVALVSGVVGMFGGGFARGALIAEVEEAIDELGRRYPDLEAARLRELAVRILDGWILSYGPTSSTVFDRRSVARELGPALDYLLAVEGTLLETDSIDPCFTAPDEGESLNPPG